jgi:hypothetical protein
MSKNNLEDVLYIIKKLNWYFGMSIQDLGRTNYSDEEKMVLKHVLNSAGSVLLDQMVNTAMMVDKVSIIRSGDPNWKPTKVTTENVQKEFNKVFGNGEKKNTKATDLLSEGQEGKKDAPESSGDPRNPEIQEGSEGP